MTCRRGGGAFLTGRIAGLLLAGTSASTAFITGVAPLGAAADNGHGRADRAVRNVATTQGQDPRDRPGDKLSVAGATRNRGYQHTSTNTAGGSSNVQNALCRRARVCNITQHVTIAGPRVTVTPAPPVKTPSARPTPVPTVTVTVTATPTPSPAAPPSAAPAAPRAAAEPAPCPAPRPLLRIDNRADRRNGAGACGCTGLLEGLLSLSVLATDTACPGASG
ncbi:hypothetical protein IL992_00645 [Microbispora sp. NEAU-D428]|uniref:hypothetical protein n=1 Tax=Microbispora sitophila TaxID=2771537 RepID=UPI0018661864|nr:hypothetical protein [Microbispora sitophila]MBE3007712.1 hypothetical protein [Microbispora sitophila]